MVVMQTTVIHNLLFVIIKQFQCLLLLFYIITSLRNSTTIQRFYQKKSHPNCCPEMITIHFYLSFPKNKLSCNVPLARNVKLPAAHAPGMPGTFSSPPRVSDHDMYQGTCVS